MAKLVIRHDLHSMAKEELAQYLRDVSEFVGLDPDLNAFDAIWMPNESGQGQALVVYARRGTAEILRNLLGVNVDDLTDKMVNGSIVFTAKGHNKDGRKEQAIGSKNLQGLQGKTLDDAIMTASTRALRRLTMQFTTLGILDESEVSAAKSEAPPTNAAASATLAPNPMPLIFAQPSVPPNNSPGKAVEAVAAIIIPTPAGPVTIPAAVALQPSVTLAPVPPVALEEQFVGQQDQIDAAMAQLAAKKTDTKPVPEIVAPAESTTSTGIKPDNGADKTPTRPKRARKPKNTVALDVEAEVVTAPSVPPPAAAPAEHLGIGPTGRHKIELPAPPPQVVTVAPAQPPTAGTPAVPAIQVAPAPVAGMPTKEQMDSYRARVGVYTAKLPASQDLGSVQKMRAFITHMSSAAPQNMTVVQWEKQVAWFDDFAGRNGVKNLVKYIDDTLGVK